MLVPPMTQRYRASVAILVKRGTGKDCKLLTVTNRRWGGFSCPGGKVERGESLVDAASRELKEETGCTPLKIQELISGVIFQEPKDNGDPCVCTTFTADIGDQLPSQQEEGTEIGWCTPARLMEDSIYTDFYKYLFRYVDPNVDLL